MGVVVQFGSGLLHVCVGRCLCHVLGSFWMPVGLGSCSCFVPRWQASGRVSLQFPLVHWDSCLLGSAFPARIVAELLPRCEASGLWYSWGLWTPGSQAIVGGLLYLPTRIINYILWQRHRYSCKHTMRRLLICVFVHFHIFLFQVLHVFFLFSLLPNSWWNIVLFHLCSKLYLCFLLFFPHLSAYTLVLLHIYCKNWNKSNGN